MIYPGPPLSMRTLHPSSLPEWGWLGSSLFMHPMFFSQGGGRWVPAAASVSKEICMFCSAAIASTVSYESSPSLRNLHLHRLGLASAFCVPRVFNIPGSSAEPIGPMPPKSKVPALPESAGPEPEFNVPWHLSHRGVLTDTVIGGFTGDISLTQKGNPSDGKSSGAAKGSSKHKHELLKL